MDPYHNLSFWMRLFRPKPDPDPNKIPEPGSGSENHAHAIECPIIYRPVGKTGSLKITGDLEKNPLFLLF